MPNLLLRIIEGGQEPYIEFLVDGEDLGQRVREALGEAGFDDALPWYGGDYSIDETVLGDGVRRDGAECVILFACGCGQSACSCVTADVAVTDRTISFSNFATWFRRGLVVASVDPVVFERGQFEDAVSRLHRDLEVWCPPAAPVTIAKEPIALPSPNNEIGDDEAEIRADEQQQAIIRAVASRNAAGRIDEKP